MKYLVLVFQVVSSVVGRCGIVVDHCGSLWIVVGRCGSLWDRCGSLWVVVDRCGSLWVVVDHCGSFRVLVTASIKLSQEIDTWYQSNVTKDPLRISGLCDIPNSSYSSKLYYLVWRRSLDTAVFSSPLAGFHCHTIDHQHRSPNKVNIQRDQRR